MNIRMFLTVWWLRVGRCLMEIACGQGFPQAGTQLRPARERRFGMGSLVGGVDERSALWALDASLVSASRSSSATLSVAARAVHTSSGLPHNPHTIRPTASSTEAHPDTLNLLCGIMRTRWIRTSEG